MKAVMLLSGGLDSRLAMKMVLDQGVELQALNHATVFCTCTAHSSCKHEATQAAEQFGVPITVKNVTQEFLRVIEKPKYGYGSGVNPCIDCRIMLFRNARRFMDEVGASFVVTGEVLGERPMSQRRDVMKLIEREAGLEGLVVRPLCALAMEPSVPEQKGWVDRERFKDITGRRRLPQMRLAEELGIGDYPCPAGGCRLTEPGFSRRMKDLMAHEGLRLEDVLLLKVGRHFRLAPEAKLVVGRNEEENKRILAHAGSSDYLLEAQEFPGPISLGRGAFDGELLRLAAGITARYGKGKDAPEVAVKVSGAATRNLTVSPTSEEEIEKWLI
jgi:tRNA U34 2-thiouridine synthase MnmA/TrmU